ncbi:unnamed protein product [Musa acuminata subsp. burmannicoides]
MFPFLYLHSLGLYEYKRRRLQSSLCDAVDHKGTCTPRSEWPTYSCVTSSIPLACNLAVVSLTKLYDLLCLPQDM